MIEYNKHFKDLRSKLKGARLLRNNGKPFFVAEVVSMVSSISLSIKPSKIPHYLIGKHHEHVDVLLRQLLLKRYTKICAELMKSIGSDKSVKIALPSEWLDYIQHHGFKIDRISSKIKLFNHSLFCLLRGVSRVFNILIRYRLYLPVSDNNYIVFMELSKKNLPLSDVKKKYDIISWYKKNYLHNDEYTKIWAIVSAEKEYKIQNNIHVRRGIFPKYHDLKKLFIYAFRMIVTFIPTLFGILRGRWWYGLLYEESVLFNYVSMCEHNQLAKEYLFHNSGWFYKPLWTYDVESRGSKVILYYYSTNIESIEFNNVKTVSYGMDLMRWNNILVWDKEQKEYLRQFLPRANINISGPIDFSDGLTCKKADKTKLTISVFAIMPARPSVLVDLGCAISPYYSDHVVLSFLSDIRDVVTDDCIEILVKQKRDSGRDVSTLGFLHNQNVVVSNEFTVIDPCYSATRLIELSDAVISIPYTSTSITSKALNKPCIFYDPSGLIKKHEHHGVPVISGIYELKKWVNLLRK